MVKDCNNCGRKGTDSHKCNICVTDVLKDGSVSDPSEWMSYEDIMKTCLNCGNNGGDKTDHSDTNPCASCGVSDSLGCVNLVPEETQIKWITKNKNYETDDKMVTHPPHYQTKSGLETIQVIEAFTDGLEGIEAVCTANVIKYICRWKKKNGLQDLKKAQWYLNYLIEYVENQEDSHDEGFIIRPDGLYFGDKNLIDLLNESFNNIKKESI